MTSSLKEKTQFVLTPSCKSRKCLLPNTVRVRVRVEELKKYVDGPLVSCEFFFEVIYLRVEVSCLAKSPEKDCVECYILFKVRVES